MSPMIDSVAAAALAEVLSAAQAGAAVGQTPNARDLQNMILKRTKHEQPMWRWSSVLLRCCALSCQAV